MAKALPAPVAPRLVPARAPLALGAQEEVALAVVATVATAKAAGAALTAPMAPMPMRSGAWAVHTGEVVVVLPGAEEVVAEHWLMPTTSP